ncbi:MAG: DUF1540 domain-containing protein [Actinobacteria bacterium]|nr:MAG: DUF1540 domain-containing protein [Actinomycetota bacterium]
MGDNNIIAACHAQNCQFNTDMRCMAKGITVVTNGEKADCATFELKEEM